MRWYLLPLVVLRTEAAVLLFLPVLLELVELMCNIDDVAFLLPSERYLINLVARRDEGLIVLSSLHNDWYRDSDETCLETSGRTNKAVASGWTAISNRSIIEKGEVDILRTGTIVAICLLGSSWRKSGRRP